MNINNWCGYCYYWYLEPERQQEDGYRRPGGNLNVTEDDIIFIKKHSYQDQQAGLCCRFPQYEPTRYKRTCGEFAKSILCTVHGEQPGVCKECLWIRLNLLPAIEQDK